MTVSDYTSLLLLVYFHYSIERLADLGILASNAQSNEQYRNEQLLSQVTARAWPHLQDEGTRYIILNVLLYPSV